MKDEVPLATVIGSTLEITIDGRPTLTLWTAELGPIAFALSSHVIARLREALTEAEERIGKDVDVEGLDQQ